MTMLNDAGLNLAQRLRTTRMIAGLEQQDMADRLGVARTTISGWERGATEPSATNFVGWALVTGQPLEWLADGVVRPKGLEPLTFWLVVDQAERAAIGAAFWSIVACQVSPDARRDDYERVA